MPPAGFEPTIPAIELPQTYALDRAANGIGTTDCTSACFSRLGLQGEIVHRKF